MIEYHFGSGHYIQQGGGAVECKEIERGKNAVLYIGPSKPIWDFGIPGEKNGILGFHSL